LPGIGSASAKKIIAGRPYKSVDDLGQSGLSKSQIAKITPLVSAGAPSAPPAASPTDAVAQKVDLNSAAQKDLEELPGVGPATAKKIIAARPYKSVDELARAGVPQSTITRLTPLVFVGSTGEAQTSSAQIPPKPGMVWVNTDSKIYHREGDPWYGKTKQGKFMTEQEAIQQGYRASKSSSESGSGDKQSK
jgi:DNA uptake protein ComE-like DNA-binding protein